jgi:sugar transferase (PEP-CTERM/EpsH1 system associated)
MRILFLTPQFPYPAHKGTTMRNYYLIAGLAPRHAIDLLSIVESQDDLRRPTPLYDVCRRMDGVTVPRRSVSRRAMDTLFSPWPDMGLRLWSPELAAKLEAWLSDTAYDVLQVEGIELARYMLALRRSSSALRPSSLVFDDHNCEYLLQQRTFETDLRNPRRWPGAVYSFVQWRKLCAFEASVCRAADHVLAVSDADAAALQRLAPGLDVTRVPNGIDAARFIPPTPQPSPPFHGRGEADMVFTGTMDFRPNVDAALWFANEVLPLIRQARTDARFVIVGQKPHRRLDVLRGRSDVVITGTVDDTRPFIAGCAVYVVPLRMGGGTRFKILEAAALGKAMVSTSLGCEGFPVQSGRELIVADSPREFAKAVVTLLQDSARRAELGTRARALAGAFDWKNIIPRMEAVYQRSAVSGHDQ